LVDKFVEVAEGVFPAVTDGDKFYFSCADIMAKKSDIYIQHRGGFTLVIEEALDWLRRALCFDD
jgi:hypothetical protein